MNATYNKILGFLPLLLMAALACSCSSTIKWDKVNIDPLTNTATFKKNGNPVTGTIAKGEKKGSYEEIVAENGNIIYKNAYLYERLTSNVDYRTRKTTNYYDNGNVAGCTLKGMNGQDSIRQTYDTYGDLCDLIDYGKRTIERYQGDKLRELTYKTIDDKDSLRITYDDKGELSTRTIFNSKTQQDTTRYYRKGGVLFRIEIFHNKKPVYAVNYFDNGKDIESEIITDENGESTKNKYNEQGKLVERFIYSGKRPLKSYEYSNGKQTKETVYDENGDVYSVNGKKIFKPMDGVQLIDCKVGYFGRSYSWKPTLLMKWKNVSGRVLSERLEIKGVFIEGNEELNVEEEYLIYEMVKSNPMDPGIVRQASLICGTALLSPLPSKDKKVVCKLYVNEKLYATFDIPAQILYTNRI